MWCFLDIGSAEERHCKNYINGKWGSEMRKGHVISIIIIVFLIGTGLISCAQEQDYQVSIDFSDGLYGWRSLGSAFVELTKEQVKTGTRSLKVTGRTASWNAALLDIDPILTDGGTYQFSVYVRLVSASEEALGHLTVRETSKSGVTEYTWISEQIPLSSEEWVLIETEPYTFSAEDLSTVSVYIEVSDGAAAYYVDEFTIVGNRPFTGEYAAIRIVPEAVIDNTLPIPSLKEVYQDKFYIGFASDANYHHAVDLIELHFNALTPENLMKWSSLHPRENQYSFWGAETLTKFARQNNMKVIGHTLVWHSQTPDWVFQDSDGTSLTRQQLLARMEHHINTVVGHFKGQVYSWDVVNEAIEFSHGSWGLRESKWKEIIGDDFIEQAFRFAHAADPDVELYYNDYGATNPGKRDAIYKMAKELLEKGVPIHGIGMQGHWSIYSPSEEEIRAAIELYSSLGLKVSITEMDVSVHGSDRENRYPTELPDFIHQQQAERYAEFFRIFNDYSDVIDRVTFWGTTDRFSWKNNHPVSNRPDHPLLFDRQGEIKPAFWAVVDPDKPWYITKAQYEGALQFLDVNGDVLANLIPGEYSIAELKSSGLNLNSIRQFSLAKGYMLEIYTESDFSNRAGIYIDAINEFVHADFKDVDGIIIKAAFTENVLLNKAVEASHLQERAARAVDGELLTSWGPRAEPPYWLSVDLGEPHLLTRWVVYHRGSGGVTGGGTTEGPLNTADFSLQVSQDKNVWYDVDAVTGNIHSVTNRAVNLVEARYVRLMITKPSSFEFNQDCVIYEWEVYGLKED